MADKRAFAKLDVGYFENPKVMDVFDASSIAICMHIASVLYCAQHVTDGVIALRAMQRKSGGTSEDSQLLIDAGLWHLPGHDCGSCPEVPAGKVYVHDYLEHNRTSDDVKGRSDAARKGARARWSGNKDDANRMQTASGSHTGTDSEPECETGETAMPREREREIPTPKGVGPRKRATRIPEDFEVTPAMVEWAKENAPDVNGRIATQKFINYWTAKSGKDATKLDWPATWRNWMLSDQEKAPGNVVHMDHSARSLAKGAALLAKFDSEQTPLAQIEG
jgi:hypothetical protein